MDPVFEVTAASEYAVYIVMGFVTAMIVSAAGFVLRGVLGFFTENLSDRRSY